MVGFVLKSDPAVSINTSALKVANLMQDTSKNERKVVNLTVHKNTLEQRKRHNVHRKLKEISKEFNECKDLNGFCLIGYSKYELESGKTGYRLYADWYVDDPIDSIHLPEIVKLKAFE